MNVVGLIEKVESGFVNEAHHILVAQQTAIGTYLYSFMLKKFWRYIGAA